MGKIVIEKTEVYGIEASMRGMRNPMNSWHLQDTRPLGFSEEDEAIVNEEVAIAQELDMNFELLQIGEKDMDLAKRLTYAGTEHCKFLRQIQVWCDITLPRYIWSELDTYKFGTKNSCSTMHKLFTKGEITLDHFYYETDYEEQLLLNTIDILNSLRLEYLGTKDYNLVRTGKRILPESFLQKRTWNTNYQELLNIYFQRKNHRMTNEWKVVCDWIETLPFMIEFIKTIESRKVG